MVLIVSLLCLIVSAWLFRRALGTLDPRRLSMGQWVFYVSLVIASFFGSLVAYYQLEGCRLLSCIHSPEARFYGWLAVQYCMLALPLGMLLANYVMGYTSPGARYEAYCLRPICACQAEKPWHGLWRWYLGLLTAISLCVVCYTYVHVGRFPLLDFVMLSPDELARIRISVDKLYTGNVYVTNIFGALLTPLLSVVAFVYWRGSRRWGDAVWFGLLFVASVLIITVDYSKSGLMFYFIVLAITFILLGVRVSFRGLFYIGLGSMLFLLVMYLLLSGSSLPELLGNWQYGIWGRIFIAQSEAIFLSMDYFPDYHDFIGFNSFSSLFGEDISRSARLLMEHYDAEGVAAGTTGVANSLFVAEAWANWGVCGVLLSPLFVGFEIQLFHILLTSGAKHPLKVALYSYLVVHLPVTGGINDFIYNVPLMAMFIVLVLPYLLLKSASYRLMRRGGLASV